MTTVNLQDLQRVPTYYDAASGFYLDISGMDIESEDVRELNASLAAPAGKTASSSRLEQMHEEIRRIEAGAVKNPDENRKVTHFTDRIDYIGSELFNRITEFAETVRRDKDIDAVIINGIGGSALGPQLLQFAVNGPYWNELSSKARNGYPKIYFLDNTDPAGLRDVLAAVDLRHVLTVHISKSGGTRETWNNMKALEHAFAQEQVDFGSSSVAVTMSGSKLAEHAEKNNWRCVFPMSESIGGRTSITSVVGHLPAALAGIDHGDFLRGALQMDENTRQPEFTGNPAYQLAVAWYIAGRGRGRRNMVIVPYADRLLLLGRYLQQLVMESLGKEKDRDGNSVNQGLTVYGNKGGTDAHAYIQQLNDGPDDFFITFIETLTDARTIFVDDDRLTMGDYMHAFKIGLMKALRAKKRKVIDIRINTLDTFSLGMLIALYERAVAAYAELINVNAFNQPGVEAYKKASKDVNSINLALQDYLVSLAGEADQGAITAEAAAVSAGLEEDVDVCRGLLERFVVNRREFGGLRLEREIKNKETVYILRP